MNNQTDGFSLTELLVTLVLLAIVSSAIVTTVLSAQRSWGTGSGQAMLTAELRRALDTMSRELVESRPAQVQRPAANGQWDTQIIFRVPQDRNGDGSVLDANGEIAEWSNNITYSQGRNNSCSKTALNDPGLLPRTFTTTLANHITALQVRRDAAAADVVEIQMTASTMTELGQIMSRTMGTRVKLRN